MSLLVESKLYILLAKLPQNIINIIGGPGRVWLKNNQLISWYQSKETTTFLYDQRWYFYYRKNNQLLTWNFNWKIDQWSWSWLDIISINWQTQLLLFSIFSTDIDSFFDLLLSTSLRVGYFQVIITGTVDCQDKWISF